MEIRNKIKLWVILLLVPIWLGQGSLYDLSFTLLFSGIVISLFSYWIKKLIMIPITFFVMGIFLVWLATSWKGVLIDWIMKGTIFIGIGLVTAVFVAASSYAKKP